MFKLQSYILGIMKKTLVFLLLLTLILSQEAGSSSRRGDRDLSQETNVGTCAKYTSDKESCLECVPHYHLFEGQCFIDIHGCNQYVFGNICRKCEHGFILVNNECCDRHCMQRIFKGYEAASELSELTAQQKVEKTITEGYASATEALNVIRYQFVKFSLASTSNQVLLGYIRYFIKIIANDKPYRCIADYEIDTKKVVIMEFRPQSDTNLSKQAILGQPDVISNDQARMALQYASGKFGLKTYGYSLQRVSAITYKFCTEFKLIYIGPELAIIIHVVVPLGNKKQPPYSPWSEERKDVQAIRELVQKSMTVVKMQNKPEMEMIKKKVSQTNSISSQKVEMKSIEKIRENVYKYTYTNTQTQQVFQEISRIDPKSNKVQIVESNQVISKDIQNMKLPESPEKKIIPKDQITQSPQVKQAIEYLERVQPSLANKETTAATVEVIGDNKRYTLMQVKNEQVSRVVVLSNEKTNQFRLIDESPVLSTPPTETVYSKTPEGKPKITTTDVEKFRTIDKQADHVIEKVEQKLSFFKGQKIESFERTDGNIVNTYQMIVKGDNPQQPKQQIRVVHNPATQEVRVIDVEEIRAPTFVEPVKRSPTTIPETQYKEPEFKAIIEQYKNTKPELKDTEVKIKKVEVQQTKYINQYTVTVESTTGQTITIKANKPHEETKPQIVSVKPVYQKPAEQPKPEKEYVTKKSVDEVTGVKTFTSSRPEDIKQSFTTQVLETITSTKQQPKVEQIQSLVTKEYEKTITETTVIRQAKRYIQVTVEQKKETKVVKKISEEVIEPVLEQSKPVLPQISTTHISQSTFTQIQKVNPALQSVTQKIVKNQPVLKNEVPVSTEIEQRGPVQVVVMVFKNDETKETKRFVSEYRQETNETTIRQETPLPKVIPKLTFEKDRTPEGDIKVVSNNIEQIKREDKKITEVIQSISQKIPLMKEQPVRIEIVSNPTNPTTNNYKISVKEPTTQQIITVEATFDVRTSKTTVSDVTEAPKPEAVTPRPVQKPVVVIKPEEVTQPQVKNVVNFVKNTVKTQQITLLKETKNTLSTCYDVTTKTSEGTTRVVTVVMDNNNPSDITLIDVVEPAKPQGSTPAPTQVPTPSYTTIVTDSANVKGTTTNDMTLVSSSKYLKVVAQEAESQQPLLKGQKPICLSEDEYEETVHVTYLATVKQGNVLISGFVWKATGKVSLVSVPTQSDTESGLTQSDYSSCAERSTTITVLTKETIDTLSKTDKQTGVVTSYVTTQFGVDSIEKMYVERFPERIRYVVLVVISSKTYRIVLVYTIKTSQFTVIERPNTTLKDVKPVILEQRVEPDGTKVVSSNTVETIKTVDEKIQKFIQTLNKQVPIEPSSITYIFSKQGVNTNEYTLTVKTETTTTEIKGIYKKDDQTVILSSVQEKPKPLIAPLVKPKQQVPKDQYKSETITKVVEEINNNKKVPNITTEEIVHIRETYPTPITQTYQVFTQTKTGKKETFVVSKNFKGEVTVIDYRTTQPQQPEQPKPAQPAPSKTEYTVNPVSGVETQVTNDEKTIKQSRLINSVLAQLTESKTVTKDTHVVSATTKTSENSVQTILVMSSPQRPEENFVVSAIVDKKTDEVKIVSQKVVDIRSEEKPLSPEQQVITTMYTPTVINKTIQQDKVLSSVVKKVTETHKEVQNTLPSQVITEKFGDKILSTVTYPNVTSFVLYDQKTGKVQELSYEQVPKNIKPLVYETQKSPEGNTIITTNSVEKIVQVNRNFHNVVSEIKQSIPSIQTEKIQGIRVEKPEQPNAPQKIVVVFESTRKNELSQVAVVFSQNKTTIIDVQSIITSEIVPTPEQTSPVKLSPKQIKANKVEEVLKDNVEELPIKQVKKIAEVHEVKTAYTKILETRVEDTNGKTYIVKTEQFGEDKPKIIDYVEVLEQKKPEIFTITTTNPKNGIVSTYTNDVKVMTEEKTYNKCVDMLENKKQLSKNGFVVDTDSISRLQRSVEHNIRYINKEKNEAIDFRTTVDSRTGQITINEETKTQFSDEKPLQKVPSEKTYIEIMKPQLLEAKKKYEFLDRSLDVIRKADYTFESKEPELTQIKQYPITQGSTGFNAVEVVMNFPGSTGGTGKKTRVVFYGEEKQPGKGYIMKIIDITPIPDEIQSTQTKIVKDEFDRKTTTTSDVKTLKQNNQEYNRIIEQLYDQIPSLSSADISAVVIKELKNANQYTLLIKKESEIIQAKVNFMKNTDEAVVTDFKTQSPKVQLEKVPIREMQSMVTVLPEQKYSEPEFIALKQKIIEEMGLPQDVEVSKIKLEQRPKADTYLLQLIDSHNLRSTVQVLKQDDTYTIVSYKPERPVETQPQKPVEQPKPSKTEYKVDEITGTQTLHTTDQKIIRESPIVRSVLNKAVQDKSIPRTSEVVQATTKTYETKIHTTIVVQQPHKPEQQTVYVAVVDREDNNNVEFITEENVVVSEEQIQTVQQTVITKIVYQTVIKKDTHLQKIVKAVQKKYDDVKDVTPVRVTMQEVGPKTITEVTYETKTVTVVSTTESEEVESTHSEHIPEQIVPGSLSTTISDDGRKTTTATNPAILEESQPQFKEVLSTITKQFKSEEIKTVVSEETAFTQIFTVLSQKPEETSPTQTVYYVNKETKEVVNMGTEEMPATASSPEPVSQPEPVKNIPETKWETKQVKSVIEEVTQVVKQQKVTKVEELKPTPTMRVYHITVDTPSGSEIVKVVVDKQTKKPEVIEQTPEKPVESAQPTETKPQQPSETRVSVEETTGIKTTTTTDKQIIRKDKVTKKVYETIVEQAPELKSTEIVSSTQKEYDDFIEQKIVLKSDETYTQVVTVTNKKTETIKIIDKSTVESSQPTSSELKVTSTTYQQVYDRDDILRRAVQFVGRRYPQFKTSKPENVNIEEFTKYVKLTLVFAQKSTTFRVVVVYDRETKSFDVIEEPSQVLQTKPVLFETTKTEQGRENYFTNDVDLLTKVDRNYPDMIEQVRKQIKISDDDLASIQSTQTSTGSVYILTTTKNNENTQVSVIYNKETKQAKINDVETVKAPEAEPAPRQTTTVPQSEVTKDDDIELIRKKSTEQSNIPSFTVEDITKVEKSKTTSGTQYVITIKRVGGVATLTATVSYERKVTVISYHAPASERPQQPTSSTEAPSKTKITYDTTTGSQIQSTNDAKVIKQSTTIKHVVDELVKTQSIPKDSEVLSTVTYETSHTIKTSMMVKTSETETKAILTVTDRKTNEVKVIAEKPVPQEQLATPTQPKLSEVVPKTIISDTIFEQVIKKDTVLQQVISEVKNNHPEIKQTKPVRVTVEKFGEDTVSEVTYKDVTVTVVSNTKTGKVEEVTSSPVPKQTDKKPVSLETTVSDDGTKTVTSNTVEQIVKVVPSVKPALAEVVKVVPAIKKENIKTISTVQEEKKYTFVSVDKTGTVTEVTFKYEPEEQKPITLFDVQQFAQVSAPSKPKEVVYEPVKLEEQPNVVKAIQKLNKTNTMVKNQVTQIVKIERVVSNMVETYKVQVKTPTSEEATITIDVNPETKETAVLDVIRYEPLKEQPKPVKVEERVDPITQIKQTVFPDKETFKDDETYPQVTDYLKTEISKGYEIVSVVKNNYGDNKQLSVLLKSDQKSPQQIQININSFNKEVTVLQNKTIVSREAEESTLLTQEQPRPTEIKLSPVDQEKFDILGKIQSVKEAEGYKPLPEIKVLEKNELFNKADEELKSKYSSILSQSSVVHASTKQTFDSASYNVYYVNNADKTKQVYHANFKINPVTQTYEIKQFNKVGGAQPVKSTLNVASDMAFGYETLDNFSNDKNFKFVFDQLKKNYPAMETAVVQSVEVLSLCNGRHNYRIFFKSGLEVIKYIVYYEEAFQRCVFLAQQPINFAKGNFVTLSQTELSDQFYFKKANQFIKQANSFISQGSEVIQVEKDDIGELVTFRIIYVKGGKTFQGLIELDKNTFATGEIQFNQLIKVPVKQNQGSAQNQNQATLKISDLAHNANFEKAHKEILSKQGSALQNAQILGAKMVSQNFKLTFTFYFLVKSVYYKITAEVDTTTKVVTITSDLERVNLESGFTADNNESLDEDVIAWAQKTNPDLKSGVIVESSRKKEIFGELRKMVFKLQTKYFTMVIYKEGSDMKILSQSESTSLEAAVPGVRSFPRPRRADEVVLNKS